MMEYYYCYYTWYTISMCLLASDFLNETLSSIELEFFLSTCLTVNFRSINSQFTWRS